MFTSKVNGVAPPVGLPFVYFPSESLHWQLSGDSGELLAKVNGIVCGDLCE